MKIRILMKKKRRKSLKFSNNIDKIRAYASKHVIIKLNRIQRREGL